MEASRTLNYVDLFAQFKRHKQYIDNVSSSTLAGYDWAWATFGELFTRPAVDKVAVVQRIAELRDGGMKPVTVNTYIRTLNTFFHWLQEEGHCRERLKVPRLKEDKKVIETLQEKNWTRSTTISRLEFDLFHGSSLRAIHP